MLGEVYRIVAGERRCLASILAGKQEIDARVFNEKPRGFELKLVQWIENTAREDLSLDERLGNVRDILKEYQLVNGDVDITATLIKTITGLSLSQSTYYLAAMLAPEDVQQQIRSGAIRNLDKAALIASAKTAELRRQAIDACVNGSSLKEIRNILTQQKVLKREQAALAVTSKRGRSTSLINMGTTSHINVITTIVSSVLTQREYDKYNDVFKNIDWSDLRQATKAFRKLIELLEVEAVV